jgi:hypothetical protein
LVSGFATRKEIKAAAFHGCAEEMRIRGRLRFAAEMERWRENEMEK